MLRKATERNILQSCPRIKLLKERGRDMLIDPATEVKLLAASPQPLRDVILIMQDDGRAAAGRVSDAVGTPQLV